MADDDLRYDRMVEDALRGVVSAALTHVVERGLTGDHHFYITFRTDHPDVVMPDQLRARYPSEMTIVLQHQYWGLEVGPDAFGITLSFSNVPERLTIPFAAVAAFADPSVRFGLQFDVGEGARSLRQDEPVVFGEAAPSEVEAANVKPLKEYGESVDLSDAAGARPGDDQDKVIMLDAFRKVDKAREK